MMSVRKQPRQLLDIAASLVEGQASREVCPFCGGGSTGELSFSIKREGSQASYICYRASCPARGRVSYGGVIANPTIRLHDNRGNNPKPRDDDRFKGEVHKLPVAYMQYFKSKYNIQPCMLHEYGFKKAGDGTILMPILEPTGKIRGENLRHYPELVSDTPDKMSSKAMIYRSEGETLLSWHRLNIGNSARPDLAIPNFFEGVLIVVEDQVSAVKASRLVDSVALLGTNLSYAKIQEIINEVNRHKVYEHVVLLLDADAYGTALKHLIRTRALIPGIKLDRLYQDIKDMSYTELKQLLTEVLKT